jgi:GH24 family phage-related lysozyme (muramidase)
MSSNEYSVSDRLVQWVAEREGYRAYPYWDVDHYSVGHGTPARPGDGYVSLAEARRRLRYHLNVEVVPYIPRKHLMKQQEIDALASFGQNLGVRPLVDDHYSTLARKLDSWRAFTFRGRKRIYRHELDRWVNPGSPYELGLRRRRKGEIAIACNGDYSWAW